MKRMVSPEYLAKMTPDSYEKLLLKDDSHLAQIAPNDNGYISVGKNGNEVTYNTFHFDILQNMLSFKEPSADDPKVVLKHLDNINRETSLHVDGQSGKEKVMIVKGAYYDGKIGYVPVLPNPTEDGTYTLKLVKSGSSITYKWVKDV